MRNPFAKLRRVAKKTLAPKIFETPTSPRDLTDEELEYIQLHGNCPYCHGELYEGPSGGLSVNFCCVDGCRARLNLAFVPGAGIMFGQFICIEDPEYLGVTG